MKHTTLALLLVAALGCGAARPAVAPPPRVDPELAGIWHACSAVGAGFCARLVLAPDGRFEARPAQGVCDRIASRVGRWGVEGDTLVIHETSRTELVGGRCDRDAIGETLLDARRETHSRATPIVERVTLAECTNAQRDESPAPCRRFGDTTRWRLATDESMEPAAANP